MSGESLLSVWRAINWDAAIAICTGLLAIFTAAMAWFTRKSVAESHTQYELTRAQSEQHHQDAFRPILILMPSNGIEPKDRSNVFYLEAPQQGRKERLVTIFGLLRNVGVGPALNVRLHFRAMGKAGYGFTRELAPIETGDRYELSSGGLRFWVQPTPHFNEADITFAGDLEWELILEYEDVFDNPFHTIHRKNPQMPWTECGKGPAPST